MALDLHLPRRRRDFGEADERANRVHTSAALLDHQERVSDLVERALRRGSWLG